MKMKRKIIAIDESRCNGCGHCESACAEGAIRIENGKARIVKESFCDGLGACVGECPRYALTIVERDADAFDPVATEQHVKLRTLNPELPLAQVLPCGCPSTHIQMFSSASGESRDARHKGKGPSYLTHWPVQIRLVPPTAPFLKGAHLLVAADCTPVAYPDFHRDFLKGKVVMMGCPKFDDTEEYIDKFAMVFKTASINSITVLIMEVPCCSKLPLIIECGLERAQKHIPVDIITVTPQGTVLKREKVA